MCINIEKNLQAIKNRIEIACEKSKRDPKDVKLLLATKNVNIKNINHALNLGNYIIGESKAQELRGKIDNIKRHNSKLHFIGHLQSNKIKDIINCGVDCVETIDRISLAEKLNNRLLAEAKNLDVFIQVNTSFEKSKFGVLPENVFELIIKVAELPSLNIKGLMTIGLFSNDLNKTRKCFKVLKKIQVEVNKLRISNVDLKELSMGMSGDFEQAIEEGATIVRIGTKIFGSRDYPDSYYWPESNSEKKRTSC